MARHAVVGSRAGRRRPLRSLAAVALALGLAAAGTVGAEPWAAPGDVVVRHDLEMLVDHGVVDLPLTTWPMSWGDISRALRQASLPEGASPALVTAWSRLRFRARAETRLGGPRLEYRLGAAKNPRRLRSFEDSPRADGEASAAVSQTWRRLSGRLQLTLAANPEDDRKYRFDGSYLSAIFGNTTVNVGLQDKWWGPGWDGTLALSSNARPVPALSIKRNFTEPFKTRWLSWMGPWTASFFIGEKEAGRGVPNAKLIGARVAFRPLESLELGLVRTAQWGGEGRNESLRSFVDLVLGRDNLGDDDIDVDNEPGNQLAGFDWRWRILRAPYPLVFYGQLVGEDEAGGFPSRYLGQLGLSLTAPVGQAGDSLAARFEFADTTCQFHESSKLFNCGYNNPLYPSGYRYRGRPIGHPADGDSRQFSLGGSLIEADGDRYQAVLRYVEINRGGQRDEAHSLSPVPSDLWNVELSHERDLLGGRATLGLGVDSASTDEPGGLDGTDVRAFIQWKTAY